MEGREEEESWMVKLDQATSSRNREDLEEEEKEKEKENRLSNLTMIIPPVFSSQ